ncbi:GNAT family N-acetyltransferase [Streptomonospora litoralis]|uniref:Acetyltransferase (GNAT) family protein n=1 Tax=Streptomonospora litoralis TaxID=2498135 RepID=A0A4P6QAW7_9ACTN|nr:GNAT family N-acetyltransferase [Streptomonospora litoralis]QBI56477.1 Acetyltransferase (GNAT) family protein [Streptomonospora litoralis]
MSIENTRATDVHYRPAAQSDLLSIADLFLTTSEAPWSREFARASHEHVLDTGTLLVAERRGEIVSVAGSIVRGRLWYLSTFWTHPEHQRSGIGMPLLRQAWNSGVSAGAEVFFTWSSSDPAAMASYMKLGMRPGYQILHFTGEPAGPSSDTGMHRGYESTDLDLSHAAKIDHDIRGCTRESDHAYFLGKPDTRGRQVRFDGEPAGYYYVTAEGNVGPLAWTGPRHADAVLALAFRDATSGGAGVSFAVPGSNRKALDFAFDSGLRFTRFNHFLTTSEFGALDRYLPSGPVLF